MPMGFNEPAILRNQNFDGGPWHSNSVHGEMSHSNSYNTPHYIVTPPYTPGNYMHSSTIEDLPPPYSSVVGTEQVKTEPEHGVAAPGETRTPDPTPTPDTNPNVNVTK